MRRTVLSLDWDWATGDCGVGPASCGWTCCNQYAAPRRRQGRGVARNGQPVAVPARAAALAAWPLVRRAPILVAECHASILRFLRRGDRVINLDAHRDCVPGTDRLYCGNWAYLAALRPGASVKWLTAVGAADRPYTQSYARNDVSWVRHHWWPANLVFLCLSSPWTPAGHDGEFYRLIAALVEKSGTAPRFVGHRARELRRAYVCETSTQGAR